MLHNVVIVNNRVKKIRSIKKQPRRAALSAGILLKFIFYLL